MKGGTLLLLVAGLASAAPTFDDDTDLRPALQTRDGQWQSNCAINDHDNVTSYTINLVESTTPLKGCNTAQQALTAAGVAANNWRCALIGASAMTFDFDDKQKNGAAVNKAITDTYPDQAALAQCPTGWENVSADCVLQSFNSFGYIWVEIPWDVYSSCGSFKDSLSGPSKWPLEQDDWACSNDLQNHTSISVTLTNLLKTYNGLSLDLEMAAAKAGLEHLKFGCHEGEVPDDTFHDPPGDHDKRFDMIDVSKRSPADASRPAENRRVAERNASLALGQNTEKSRKTIRALDLFRKPSSPPPVVHDSDCRTSASEGVYKYEIYTAQPKFNAKKCRSLSIFLQSSMHVNSARCLDYSKKFQDTQTFIAFDDPLERDPEEINRMLEHEWKVNTFACQRPNVHGVDDSGSTGQSSSTGAGHSVSQDPPPPYEPFHHQRDLPTSNSDPDSIPENFSEREVLERRSPSWFRRLRPSYAATECIVSRRRNAFRYEIRIPKPKYDIFKCAGIREFMTDTMGLDHAECTDWGGTILEFVDHRERDPEKINRILGARWRVNKFSCKLPPIPNVPRPVKWSSVCHVSSSKDGYHYEIAVKKSDDDEKLCSLITPTLFRGTRRPDPRTSCDSTANDGRNVTYISFTDTSNTSTYWWDYRLNEYWRDPTREGPDQNDFKCAGYPPSIGDATRPLYEYLGRRANAELSRSRSGPEPNMPSPHFDDSAPLHQAQAQASHHQRDLLASNRNPHSSSEGSEHSRLVERYEEPVLEGAPLNELVEKRVSNRASRTWQSFRSFFKPYTSTCKIVNMTDSYHYQISMAKPAFDADRCEGMIHHLRNFVLRKPECRQSKGAQTYISFDDRTKSKPTSINRLLGWQWKVNKFTCKLPEVPSPARRPAKWPNVCKGTSAEDGYDYYSIRAKKTADDRSNCMHFMSSIVDKTRYPDVEGACDPNVNDGRGMTYMFFKDGHMHDPATLSAVLNSIWDIKDFNCTLHSGNPPPSYKVATGRTTAHVKDPPSPYQDHASSTAISPSVHERRDRSAEFASTCETIYYPNWNLLTDEVRADLEAQDIKRIPESIFYRLTIESPFTQDRCDEGVDRLNQHIQPHLVYTTCARQIATHHTVLSFFDTTLRNVSVINAVLPRAFQVHNNACHGFTLGNLEEERRVHVEQVTVQNMGDDPGEDITDSFTETGDPVDSNPPPPYEHPPVYEHSPAYEAHASTTAQQRDYAVIPHAKRGSTSSSNRANRRRDPICYAIPMHDGLYYGVAIFEPAFDQQRCDRMRNILGSMRIDVHQCAPTLELPTSILLIDHTRSDPSVVDEVLHDVWPENHFDCARKSQGSSPPSDKGPEPTTPHEKRPPTPDQDDRGPTYADQDDEEPAPPYSKSDQSYGPVPNYQHTGIDVGSDYRVPPPHEHARRRLRPSDDTPVMRTEVETFRGTKRGIGASRPIHPLPLIKTPALCSVREGPHGILYDITIQHPFFQSGHCVRAENLVVYPMRVSRWSCNGFGKLGEQTRIRILDKRKRPTSIFNSKLEEIWDQNTFDCSMPEPQPATHDPTRHSKRFLTSKPAEVGFMGGSNNNPSKPTTCQLWTTSNRADLEVMIENVPKTQWNQALCSKAEAELHSLGWDMEHSTCRYDRRHKAIVMEIKDSAWSSQQLKRLNVNLRYAWESLGYTFGCVRYIGEESVQVLPEDPVAKSQRGHN